MSTAITSAVRRAPHGAPRMARSTTGARAVIDFGAYSDEQQDPGRHDDPLAVHWLATARRYLAHVVALRTLVTQVHATVGVPRALGSTLAISEVLLVEQVKAAIATHTKLGGDQGPVLTAELDAARDMQQ